MNIHEQLETFLAELGVTMETGDEGVASLPEVSLFQSSREHYGIFYRVDLVQRQPQLRVLVPTDDGLLKLELYLVRLAPGHPLSSGFSNLAGYYGSSAFERERETADQHLLHAVAETMKQLFWSGDLESMCFPLEIEVQRLL